MKRLESPSIFNDRWSARFLPLLIPLANFTIPLSALQIGIIYVIVGIDLFVLPYVLTRTLDIILKITDNKLELNTTRSATVFTECGMASEEQYSTSGQREKNIVEHSNSVIP